MLNETENEEIISVAMKIILNAGDARNYVMEALKLAREFKFEEADKLMKKAESSIIVAHKAQTAVIQNEAAGKHYDFSLLFAHAQDTIMTINSEMRMANEMIEILKIIENKLK